MKTTQWSKNSKSKSKSKSIYIWWFFVLLIAIIIIIANIYKFMSESGNHVDLIEHKEENENVKSKNALIQKNNTELELSIPATINAIEYKKVKIGFAITITRDGKFLDGAAVLAYSIDKAFRHEKNKLEISLISFVHPNVTTSIPHLKRIGYHVIECETPIIPQNIKFKFLREHINRNGCCGAAELIKLYAYKLLQYDKIVHMDADVLVLNSFTHTILKPYSLIYTTDPNMATHKGEDKMPVQGGFLIIKPSLDDYNNILRTIMSTIFYQGGGWNGSKIGWFWGGMTIQGILPYYYRKVTIANRSHIEDRCYYNTMADTPECEKQSLRDIFTAHFTVCQKPWTCYLTKINRLCSDLHKTWFEFRKEAEIYYGLNGVEQLVCPRGGHKWYKPMQLDYARLPSYSIFYHEV
jgi:hypothetical protein